ncbi:uncharacterized protein PG998_007959 [Apiospora kogelbergensis]|uniref:uncharacterized protein n=1 Tax=Apiospora kogelbergensis TaxID=1337665 RepID=UPI0031328E36
MASVVTNQPNAIADDWQDVGETTDDTFSFVSLSISEDSQDEADGDDKSKTLSVPSRDAATNKNPAQSSPTMSDGEESEQEEQDLDRLDNHGNARSDAKDVGTLQPAWSSAASINQILDADWNPPYLLKVTTSLGKLTSDIMSAISFHGNFAPLEGAKELRCECSHIRDALKTLEPMVEGYVKHWDTAETSDLPLDPGLYEWISNLRIELLGLQRLLQRHMGQAHSASDADDASLDITKYMSSLVESNAAISGFLPILQADYDEFHAANLSMAPPNGSPACGHYETHSGPGNDASISRLRRELYDLKDVIDSCQGQFCLLIRRQAATLDPEALQSLAKSYALIKAGLGTMLSNHASEWLDFSMAGGITYNEFCQLHPDTIRSLILQLRDVHANLGSELYHVNEANRGTPEADHMPPEVKEGDIGTLRTLQEVLCSLLRIKLPPREQSPPGPEKI